MLVVQIGLEVRIHPPFRTRRASGEPQQAHHTDEYCSMQRIRQSVAIYEELMRDWCGI